MRCLLLRCFPSSSSHHETKRGHCSLFCPGKVKKVRETCEGIERAEEQEEREAEELVERRQVMKVRALTQGGTFHRVRRKRRVRRKKTYRDRERNSQRDSRWIHAGQVLHH